VADNVIVELRQLLQDRIVPDLKLIAIKLDALQRHMEQSHKATEARLEAYLGEQTAFSANGA
jgi:hypothetical protein